MAILVKDSGKQVDKQLALEIGSVVLECEIRPWF